MIALITAEHPNPNTGARQSINSFYTSADGAIAFEWLTDDPNQQDAVVTARTLTDMAYTHVSDIPESLVGFRK